MSYQLVLTQSPAVAEAAASGGANATTTATGTRDVGENVFWNDLPEAYKVFLFYYPGAMPNDAVEDALRGFGQRTGKNLFVNLGSLNDPDYDRISKLFGFNNPPVIVMTATADLASPATAGVTAFVRLDSKKLLNSPERTLECVDEIFHLFLQGEVADAIRKAKWTQRAEIGGAVLNALTKALKVVGKFIDSRDIAFSVAEGKFELKRSGG